MSHLVNTLGVVGTACRDRSHSTVELLEQDGNPSAIMRSTTGQIRGDDLASVRVNRKVQLPQIADVNPEAGAGDEQVDRPIVCDRVCHWLVPARI